MKLLLPLLAVLGLGVLVLPLLTVATVATHPWLAVGVLVGPVQVVVPTPAPTAGVPGPPQISLGDVVQRAETWLGTRYAFGGCSRNGVDCSCLVMLVYRAVGVNLPRVASDQFVATSRLSRDDLVPGDLVFFANTYMPGISDVRAFALQVQAAEGARVALIVIDYVQLLRDEEGDGRSRERNVSAAVRGLKALAQELQVPVLAAVQFNRNLDSRVDKRPNLTDLRDSGDLKNTADSVLGLYRDGMHHPDSDDKLLTEIVVLKKRQLGEDVGSVRRLVWLGESYGDLDWRSAQGRA